MAEQTKNVIVLIGYAFVMCTISVLALTLKIQEKKEHA